jgi:regulator of protease activity HflC (stomatin/prohibitin superfamily)
MEMKRHVTIKESHQGLRYVDGQFVEILQAGRYTVEPAREARFLMPRRPAAEIVLVDMRERELTIKGQEILTSDKVALRVSIIVQFQVVDPRAALHRVANYEDRLYSDVQLAARRSLASMTLEEILTNRTRLSQDIQRDVVEVARTYGVAILRSDVKDIVFPGNVQEVMNRVLVAERMSQVQLVEARTKSEVQQIETQAKLEARRLEVEALAASTRLAAEREAEKLQIAAEADVRALRVRQEAAAAYAEHPALLRLAELQALRDLAHNANARLYVGFEPIGMVGRPSEQD